MILVRFAFWQRAKNDIAELQYSPEHYAQLIAGGIDSTMARHVAHMFVRDPLQVFKERIVQVGAAW